MFFFPNLVSPFSLKTQVLLLLRKVYFQFTLQFLYFHNPISISIITFSYLKKATIVHIFFPLIDQESLFLSLLFFPGNSEDSFGQQELGQEGEGGREEEWKPSVTGAHQFQASLRTAHNLCWRRWRSGNHHRQHQQWPCPQVEPHIPAPDTCIIPFNPNKALRLSPNEERGGTEAQLNH